ncbi:hypothetical protein HDU98_004415, partial [Podochytrium sp. JEL0797]
LFEDMNQLERPVVETFETLKKARESHKFNKENAQEALDAVIKAQQDAPQKKKELEKLVQKSALFSQKNNTSNQTAAEAQFEHDDARATYLREVLPRFQSSLMEWAESRNKSIKQMLTDITRIEQIAVDKTVEACIIGKDSANSFDVRPIVSQFADQC